MERIEKLLIIGCGNMGGAMLAGWLAAGVAPSRFAILDPALKGAPEGVTLYREVSEASSAGHDAVLLGFKPQQLEDLAPRLRGLAGDGVAVYSLLAGFTISQLKSAFSGARAHIRVMPNLAARIGKSPIILLENGLSEEGREDAFAFFDKLGTAVWLAEEAKFDLVTALAGSGPGFVYRFIDALAEAAQELGLEKAQATSLALSMVEGASLLAAGADVSPGALADQVASPGGMTREGLNVLDANQSLVNLLIKTLKATAERGAELSAGAD